jgi:dipeptidyl aminopeptidase/acylaminoacyl peptidase
MARKCAGWAVLLGGLAIMIGIAAILIESALHVPDSLHTVADPRHADALVREQPAKWRSVEIAAADGTRLRGWFFRPQQENGTAVLALHGVADNRTGVLGHARILLRNGYAVLTPDQRGHGESGPSAISYGLRESDDVKLWVDWLSRQSGVARVYGLGESYGAAVLLQSLPGEPRIKAAIAECAFSSFRTIAAERIGQKLGLGGRPSAVLFAPVVGSAFLYAQLRYGLRFQEADPELALSRTNAAIFLIHGAVDANIAPAHSLALARASRNAELWIVKNAGHTGALAADPAEFERRVIGWLARVERPVAACIGC